MFELESSYPLRNISNKDLLSLGKVLWDWQLCDSCTTHPGEQLCSSHPCPGVRWAKLSTFFDYYKTITRSYVPDIVAGKPPALENHNDLLAIVQLLKENPTAKRSQLTVIYFAAVNGKSAPTTGDQNRALNLALRVLLMTTCCLESRLANDVEAGSQPIPWRDDMSWTQLLGAIFPTVNYGSNRDDMVPQRVNELITARRLTKVARLRFVPTNELGHHLRLDQRDGTVALYHHTAFLKESLIASRSNSIGHIPRDLAIEVLDSIQRTLFPPHADAQNLLQLLVSKHHFDADCLTFEPSTYRIEGEERSRYRHLESRLMDLYEELVNPSPRGIIEKWLERKSGSRYVMMATLGGVIAAVILGALALIVSIFQAWIGWQQWQHPVGTGT